MSKEKRLPHVSITESRGTIFAETSDGIYTNVSLYLQNKGPGSRAEAKRIVSLLALGIAPFVVDRPKKPQAGEEPIVLVPQETAQERSLKTLEDMPIIERVYGEDMAKKIMLGHMAKTIIKNS